MSTTSLTTKHNKHYIRYTVTSGCISFCFQNKKYFLVSKPFGEEIAKRKILIMNIAEENRQNGISENSCKSHIYLI